MSQPGSKGKWIAAASLALALSSAASMAAAQTKNKPAAKPAQKSAPVPASTAAEEEAAATSNQARATADAENAAKLEAIETRLKAAEQNLGAVREETARQIASERTRREQAEAALRVEVTEVQAAAKAAADRPAAVTAKQWGVSLTGFLQADLPMRQSSESELNFSTGEPLNEDRFYLRRARLRPTLEQKYVAGALEMDFNTVRGSQARIVGAEASVKLPGATSESPPLVMATVGLFKIPFGFEVLESDRTRLFMERSTVIRALFPGEYDAGARVQGGWLFLRYAFAVQNGEPIGERTFPLRDPNRAKDVVGRVGFEAAGIGPVALSGGVSALTGKGFHKGSAATKNVLNWQDRNENGRVDSGELLVQPGTSATASQNFSRHALGLDARLRLNLPVIGETAVYGEVIFADDLDRGVQIADPLGPLQRDAREFGYYVALTQDLTPYAAVGVRYDKYDPDRDSTNRDQGRLVPTRLTYQTLAVTAALRAPLGRLIFEYDLNRNHLGRDAAGNPANLKDNAFIARAEVRF